MMTMPITTALLMTCGRSTRHPNGLHRLRVGLLVVLIGVTVVAGYAETASAQFGFRRSRGEPTQNDEESLGTFPYDRNLANTFDRCKRLIEQANYADALEGLDGLLAQEKDSALKPVKGKETYLSLKRETLKLIGSLPPEGLEAYRLQFGATADKSLRLALASGNIDRLGDVVRRYFHTTAGNQAAYLLSQHHLDHGRPLAAALLLKTLSEAPGRDAAFQIQTRSLGALAFYRAGKPDQAVQLLSQAVASGQAQSPLAGGPLPLDGNVENLKKWLSDAVGPMPAASLIAAGEWAMFRGNPARNATMSGGSPLLNPRWSSDVVQNSQLELQTHTYRRNLLSQGLPAIPALQALAVGDTIVYRTASPERPIAAIEFETGKLSWYYRNSSVSPGGHSDDVSAAQRLNLRNWNNLNNGGLSSDGKNVYFVEDDQTGGDVNGLSERQMIMMQRRWGGPFGGGVQELGGQQPSNRLYALELATQGKLKWVVGGKESEMEPRLANVTFLGAPLPLNGSLYLLAENKQAISLVVLDGATGQLQWTQELLLLEEQNQAMLSAWRRIVGASPTYFEGLLLCPTATGDLVAVDLVQRTLAWTYRAQQGNRPNENIENNPFFLMMMSGGNGMVPGSIWSEAVAVAAEGMVLYTSPEADRLYCLDLQTGSVKWELPRKQNLYLGGVAGDRVVIVGKREVQCVSLKDRKSLWNVPLTLPTGAVPSGRGFLSGEDYYLPVGSGDVLRIDLVSGKIKSQAHASGGTIPGNLLCYQGHVVSMGVDRVEKYAQSELLKKQVEATLANFPQDWQALGWRGEIALDEHRLPDALNDLRAATIAVRKTAGEQYESRRPYYESQLERLNTLLFTALHATIQTDFAAHRSELTELETLVGDDRERAAWLRLAATGSEQIGRSSDALGYYFALSELDHDPTRMEQIDPLYEVDRNAWIQARLKNVWQKISADERSQWSVRFQSRLDQALAGDPSSRTRSVRRYAALFGFHPTGDDAREMELKLLGGEDPLRSETLLKTLSNAADPARRRQATARLASLYQSVGRDDAAAELFRELRDRHGDEICLEGHTGKQWYASVPTDSRLGKILSGANEWPTGLIEETRNSGKRDRREQVNQQMFSVMEIQGAAGGPLESHQLLYDQNSSILVLRDGHGHDVRRIALNRDDSLQFGLSVPGSYALARDHLLLVDLGWRIVAVDLLDSERGKGRSQSGSSWKYDFVDAAFLATQSQYGNGVMSFQESGDISGWGIRRRTMVNPRTKQPYGAIAFCGKTGLAVYRQREVSLLDALTGEPIWTRRNLPEDCELSGDDEHIVLLTKDGKQSRILRAADGEPVTTRDLPERRSLLAKRGTQLLVNEAQSGKRRLSIMNVLNSEKTLLGEYAEASRGGGFLKLFDDEAIVVSIGPKPETARLEVFSLQDGKRRFMTFFPLRGPLRGFDVRRDRDAYYTVLDNGAINRQEGKYIYQPAVHDGTQRQLMSGDVYAFDRATGTSMWPASATIQQHAIWAAQPTELPCLTFVRAGIPKNGGHQIISILCLDKKTGRLVYRKDDLSGQPQSFDVVGDPETKQVSLIVTPLNGDLRSAIVLAYTDRPRPPEPPYQESLTNLAAAKSSSGGIGGLFNGLRRALEGSSNRNANRFDSPEMEIIEEEPELELPADPAPAESTETPADEPPDSQTLPAAPNPASNDDPFAPFGG